MVIRVNPYDEDDSCRIFFIAKKPLDESPYNSADYRKKAFC